MRALQDRILKRLHLYKVELLILVGFMVLGSLIFASYNFGIELTDVS
jgi:folate-dependent phosphoribosylglycinamide formyltransferase PurN